MTDERRKEIEKAATIYGITYSIADDGSTVKILGGMLREVLDELDLRMMQIAICRHMLGLISGDLGTIGNELEGLKSEATTRTNPATDLR